MEGGREGGESGKRVERERGGEKVGEKGREREGCITIYILSSTYIILALLLITCNSWDRATCKVTFEHNKPQNTGLDF